MARTQFDYTASHGPVWGTINATLAALVAAGAGRLLHLPAWWPLAFALVGAAATIYACHHHKATLGNTIFWTCCWLVPATWTAYTIAFGWSGYGVGVLLSVALAAGVLSPTLGRLQTREGGLLESLRTGLHAEWEDRITRICGFREKVTVTKIEPWPDDVGYTVHLRFPAGLGYTWEDLRDRERGLASAAGNLKGCPVRAADSDFQNEALLKVTRINGLQKEILYPKDYGPLTVREAFPLGLLADRTLAMAEVRQSAGLVAGRRGGGKTNILDVFTANLCRCPDAAIWHIDLNGGGMSVPWMLPYVSGLVDTPPVDWVARTPEEALLMTRVALAIAKDRKARYGALKAQNNTRLLPVSATLPEILIIVDEGAEVMGEDASAALEVARNLRTLQRIGRAEAVNVIFSSLRATGETIPVPVRKQCALRIGTKVEEDSELDYLFNYDRGLRSADLMYAGCAYLQTEAYGRSPLQFKAFHLLPEQMAEIVIATNHLRPALDAQAVKVGGAVYAQRWDRTRPYLTALAGEDGELEVADVDRPATGPSGDPVSMMRELTSRMGQLVAPDRAAKQVFGMDSDRLRREAESIFALDTADPDRDAAPVAKPTDETAPPADTTGRRALVRRIVTDAGLDGIRTSDILAAVKAAGVNVNDATVYEWLKAEKAGGSITSPRQGWWKVQAA